MKQEKKIKIYRAFLESVDKYNEEPELISILKTGFEKCYVAPLHESIGNKIQQLIKKVVPETMYDNVVEVIKKAKSNGKSIEDLISDAKNIDMDKAKSALAKAKELVGGVSEDTNSADDAVFESINSALLEGAVSAKMKNFLLAFVTASILAGNASASDANTDNINSDNTDPQQSEQSKDVGDAVVDSDNNVSDDDNKLANKMISDMLRKAMGDNSASSQAKKALNVAKQKMIAAGFDIAPSN